MLFPVISAIWRCRIAAILTAAGLVSSAFTPAIHAHVHGRAGSGEVDVAAHQHFAGHRVHIRFAVTGIADHGGDDHIVWMNSDVANIGDSPFAPEVGIAALSGQVVSYAAAAWHMMVAESSSFIHGPPTDVLSLRAPPRRA